MNYSDYIISDSWKKKRNLKLGVVDHCQICDKKTKLHVHHKTYKRFQNEIVNDLMVLCSSCHSLWHHYLPTLVMRHKHISRIRRCIKLGMVPKMAFLFFKNRVSYKFAYQVIVNKLKTGELRKRQSLLRNLYSYWQTV